MAKKLVLTQKDIERIKNIIKYAKEHPINNKTLEAVMDGKIPSVNIPRNLIWLKQGLKVTYSFEEHHVGMCKHLSISSRGLFRRTPCESFIKIIMSVFGMGSDLRQCLSVWIDKGTVNILNFAED